MKRSLLLAAAALAAVTLVAAGCGDTDEVPADAVAVVDGTTITKASLEELLARAKKSYAAQQRDFPKAGTADYQTLQNQAVAYLVQREEYANEADDLGIKVSDEEITKKVDEVKKQYFKNDQKKFEAGLKQQGYTVEALREDLVSQLVSQKIYENLTKSVKVSDAELQKYYDENKTQYSVAESRAVRHILVKTKAEADAIHSQLESGADFAKLAKESSLDPGSKDAGREADRVARPDRRAVRQGGVLARDERAVRPRQDRVRLPPHPAARGGEGRLRDALRRGQGADPHPARRGAEEQGRQRLGDGDREEVQGQGHVRRRLPAAGHVDHRGRDDHRRVAGCRPSTSSAS